MWNRGQYQIFTRSADLNANWYFQLSIGGKRVKTSLDTPEAATAIEKARLLLEAAGRGILDKMRALLDGKVTTPAFSPLADVWAWMDKQANTRHREVMALQNVLRTLFATPDNLTTEVLAPDLAIRWKKLHEQKCFGKSQDEANRIKRTANSTLHNGKSIFSVERLSDMKRAGLVFPDMQLFFNEIRARKFKKLPKKAYMPVPNEVTAKVLAGWRTLPRNDFLAVGLMLACGLRKSTVSQVQWKWFTKEQNRPLLANIADVKNNKGRVHVFPIDPFWRLMHKRIEAEQWRGLADDYVIAGTATDRHEEVFRRISAWLRRLAWPLQKTNHGFRDFAGSQVAMKYGLDAAREFLDHASVLVTEAHYQTFVKSHVTAKPFVKWATL